MAGSRAAELGVRTAMDHNHRHHHRHDLIFVEAVADVQVKQAKGGSSPKETDPPVGCQQNRSVTSFRMTFLIGVSAALDPPFYDATSCLSRAGGNPLDHRKQTSQMDSRLRRNDTLV
jgi:hypothetical protein